MSRERALALGYVAQAVTMGLTAGAIFAGEPVWAVYLCVALASCALTLTRPVYSAMLSSLSHTPEELTAANAVSSWAEGLGVFAGPLIAGSLLAVSGPALAFVAMAVAQVVAAVLALGVSSHPDSAGDSAAPETHASLIREITDGFRETRNEQGASVLLLLVGCQFAIIGMLDILSVELAFSVLYLDPSGPGILSAALGVGGLFGATFAMIRLGQKRLASPFVLGALANGVPLLLFGLPMAFGVMVAVAFLAVAGGGKSFADVTSKTLLQRTVRDDTLARVFGLQEGLSDAGMALGSVLAPLLVVWWGAGRSRCSGVVPAGGCPPLVEPTAGP
jgi:predicted MFS family arabinose efflux permease